MGHGVRALLTAALLFGVSTSLHAQYGYPYPPPMYRPMPVYWQPVRMMNGAIYYYPVQPPPVVYYPPPMYPTMYVQAPPSAQFVPPPPAPIFQNPVPAPPVIESEPTPPPETLPAATEPVEAVPQASYKTWPGLELHLPSGDNNKTRAETYEPQPGDLVLFRHRGFFLVALQKLVLCGGGATHAALLVGRSDGRVQVLESPLFQKVRFIDLPEVMQQYHGKIFIRRRLQPLTEEQSSRLTTFAEAQENKPYQPIGLLIPTFSWRVRFPFERCLNEADLNQPRWICSSLVVSSCVYAGLISPCVARPSGTCAGDLMSDLILDLSSDWDKPALCTFVTATKR